MAAWRLGALGVSAGLVLSMGAACGGAPAASEEDDLTSLTARERKLTFEGYVYVEADAGDAAILRAVREQTQSAFGALREANISVASRELAGVDAETFEIEDVTVVAEDGSQGFAKRVRYRYVDQAVVPTTMARRSAVHLGLLHGDYQAQSKRVLEECTWNTAHDRDFEDSVWYVWNPSLERCKKAMAAEQAAIDEARERLLSPEAEVVPEEIGRLYLPMTARLEPKKMTAGKVYPEYDRLFSGGAEPGALKVSLVNGEIDHPPPGSERHLIEDSGYEETVNQLWAILEARPDMELVSTEPEVDLSRIEIPGRTAEVGSFRELLRWERENAGFPEGTTYEEKKALRREVGTRIFKKWLKFEEKVLVSIAGAEPEPFTIRVEQYYGAGSDSAPHRRGLKSSDVFIYSGHSYIGSGPLDPNKFGPEDFSPGYQILFIDGCVSFNYYNKDYFELKPGGSRDLDTITNGLESYADGAGAASGRFVAELLGGRATYKELLETAGTDGTDYAWGKDALRVVDGEVDNAYAPSETPVEVSPAP